MNDQFKSLLGLKSQAGTIQVRNVLSPLLWLTALCLPTGLVSSNFVVFESAPYYALVIFGMSPAVLAMLSYVYFGIFRPTMLQSESYQLRYEELRIMSKSHGEYSLPKDITPTPLDVSPRIVDASAQKDVSVGDLS